MQWNRIKTKLNLHQVNTVGNDYLARSLWFYITVLLLLLLLLFCSVCFIFASFNLELSTRFSWIIEKPKKLRRLDYPGYYRRLISYPEITFSILVGVSFSKCWSRLSLLSLQSLWILRSHGLRTNKWSSTRLHWRRYRDDQLTSASDWRLTRCV